MGKQRLLHALFIATLLLPACRGCGKDEGPESILDLPTADAAFVVHVPELQSFLRSGGAFVESVSSRAGRGFVDRARQSLQQQLGVDPLSVASYRESGLDPSGPVLLFSDSVEAEPLLVLPVAERETLTRALRELIEKTDGATHFDEHEVRGFSAITAGRPFGDELIESFHWAYVGRYVLIARHRAETAWLGVLERLSKDGQKTAANEEKTADEAASQSGSLRTDPLFRDLSRRLPTAPLTLFVRGEAAKAYLPGSDEVPRGAISRLTLDASGVAVQTFIASEMKELAEATEAQPVMPLAARVEGDAVVLALTRAADSSVLDALSDDPRFSKWTKHALASFEKATGLDAKKEIVPLLEGPLTVSVHLGDLSQLPARLKRQRSIRALASFVDIVVTADLEKPDELVKLLTRAAEQLGERGVDIRQRQSTVADKKATIFEPDIETPRLGWAVWDGHYVYALGRGRLAKALKTLAADDAGSVKELGTSAAAKLVRQEGTSVVVLRLGVLVDAVTGITMGRESPIGLGAFIGETLKMVETLGDVALGIDVEPDGLRVILREQLQ